MIRGAPLRRTARRPRHGDSPRHLAFIRRLPCCACPHPSGPGGEAHHLLRVTGEGGARGTGMTTADRWAVPACREHHRALHEVGDEIAFFARLGVDACGLADSLGRVSGDGEAGEREVLAAWNRA